MPVKDAEPAECHATGERIVCGAALCRRACIAAREWDMRRSANQRRDRRSRTHHPTAQAAGLAIVTTRPGPDYRTFEFQLHCQKESSAARTPDEPAGRLSAGRLRRPPSTPFRAGAVPAGRKVGGNADQPEGNGDQQEEGKRPFEPPFRPGCPADFVCGPWCATGSAVDFPHELGSRKSFKIDSSHRMSTGKRLAKRSIIGTRVCVRGEDGIYYAGVINAVKTPGSSSGLVSSSAGAASESRYSVRFDPVPSAPPFKREYRDAELIGPGFRTMASGVVLLPGQKVFITYNGREVAGSVINHQIEQDEIQISITPIGGAE
ncbi:unnamed protein product, partial [Nesidiocoris tenuis]